MKRFLSVDSVGQRLKEVGVPDNLMARHMLELDLARARREQKASKPVLTKKGKRKRKYRHHVRANRFQPTCRDRYPRE